MLELTEKLCNACAPSGCEDEVIHIIKKYLDTICVNYKVFPSGNMVVTLPSHVDNAPYIMVQCHMDEAGFMIKGHRDGGYMSISPLGLSEVSELVGKRITVLAEKKYCGFIGAVPVHLSKGKDKPQMDDLYADIGINSKEEAVKKIPLGSFGCFSASVEYFGKDDGFISGKALSSRVPCAILLEAIRKLKNARLPVGLLFAFTVRGKLSLNGAPEVYNRIHPDAVLSVIAIPACDTPDNCSPICRLGHGAVISDGEVRYRYDAFVTNQLRNVADDMDILTQSSRPMTEDDEVNHDIIRMKNAGARVSALKIPVRNVNSACEVMSKADIRAVYDLLCNALPKLDV